MFKSIKDKIINWNEDKKILKQFDSSFNSIFNFSKYKNAKKLLVCEYLQYNTIDNKNTDLYIKRSIQYDNQNIEEKALKKINEGLKKIYVYQSAIDYYEKLLENSKSTARRINSDALKNQYITRFKDLYFSRMKYLGTIQKSCINIISELRNAISTLEGAIKELEKHKNKSFFEKAVTFAGNIAIAPFRHAANIIDGIDKKDTKKIVVGGALLGLSFLGGAVIADAIDALDGIDITSPDIDHASVESPSNFPGSEVNTHHVEPHPRVLSDGTITWVDGDGNPNTTLSSGQGGGYLRTNPDGNPFNNFSN